MNILIYYACVFALLLGQFRCVTAECANNSTRIIAVNESFDIDPFENLRLNVSLAELNCHVMIGGSLNLENLSISDFQLYLFNSYTQLDLLRVNMTDGDSKLGIVPFKNRELLSLSLAFNNLKRLRRYAFYGLKRLSFLDLSSNQIESIENGTFYGLFRLQQLYLEKNAIKKIQKLGFEGLNMLAILSLSGNEHISVVNASAYGVPQLVTLEIASAGIRTLENMSFTGLDMVQNLLLDDNKIESLANATFYGLPNLAYLYLAKNLIKTLDDASFHGLANLKALYLNSNLIRETKNARFAGLNQNLELLDFRGNFLYLRTNFTLNGIDQLQTLDLSGYSPKTLSNRLTFHGLSTLKTLIFRYNFLESVQNGSFRGLANLLTLDLKNNLIQRIRRFSFIGLASLKILDLRYNLLEILDETWFDGLPSLTSLYLSSNWIYSVESFKLKGLHQGLVLLDLSANLLRRLGNYDFSTNVSILNLQLNPLNEIHFRDDLNSSISKIFFSYKLPRRTRDLRNEDNQLYFNSSSLLFFHYKSVDVEKLLNYSNLFFRKEMRYYSMSVKFFQSVPIKVNQPHGMNCSLLFALYRKCKFLRLFVGDRSEYESLIETCSHNEAVHTNLDLNTINN